MLQPEGDDLNVLLDFLIGFSVVEIAERFHVPPESVEESMRCAFTHYAFVAKRLAIKSDYAR